HAFRAYRSTEALRRPRSWFVYRQRNCERQRRQHCGRECARPGGMLCGPVARRCCPGVHRATARLKADRRPVVITPAALTRAAGAAAIAAGAIFIGVQLGHPALNATSISTTDVEVRDFLKIIMCGLALAGITGMYLSQVHRNGVLGLVGYIVFAV